VSKFIITFGRDHVHCIDGKIFDCHCVAEVDASNEDAARKLFMPKFCYSHPEDKWDEKLMRYFPRGKIHIKI